VKGATPYIAAGAMLVGAILANHYTVAHRVDGNTGLPVPTKSGDHRSVVIYEDGSGVQYSPNGQELRTFDEGTFVWECSTMGNRICGPK
jgi:hypothetical protein